MKSFHVCRTTPSRHAQSGFAIILVMGLLLVAAAVTATLMARQENETVWAPIEGTQDQIDTVSKAIAAYQRRNHRLPLPAARTQEGTLVLHSEATSIVASDYTLPKAASDAFAAGASAVAGEGGLAYTSNDPTNLDSVVVIGAIPTETLGLPRTAAEDSYGRLLTYAVTLASANPFTYEASEGAITLQDNNGAEVANKLSYIVIAHGKEGAGAWSAKSRFQGRDCGGDMNHGKSGEDANSNSPVSDQGNCDENDATFVVHDVTLVAGEGYFDDQLLRGKKDKVAQTISRPCAAGAVTWGAGNECSAMIPDPGIMHNASSLQPREIEFLLGQASCPPVVPGAASPICTTNGPVLGRAVVTCNNGTIVVSEPTCTVKTDTCELPWGGHISVGDSVEAWTADTYPCGAPGPASEMRECVDNGDGSTTLTGGNLYGSVTPPVCDADCAAPWGGTVANGDSVTAYNFLTCESKAACSSEERVCTNGVLSGSYTQQKDCHDHCAAPAECTAPWGAPIADGDSVTAYDFLACESKAACNSEERVCTNGVLSGSYTQQKDCHDHCPAPASCTTPWGATIADGNKVTSHSTCDTGGKSGDSCTLTEHSCSDGSFSPPISGAQSCNCLVDDGGIGSIELPDDDQSCSQEGQCVDCCVPTAETQCPAVDTSCRCNSGVRTYDVSCGGGGGGPVM